MGKRIILGLLMLAMILAATAASAVGVASAAMPWPPGPQHPAMESPYVDPFAAPGWEPARTDMGVDWFVTRPLPVVAIGDGVILGSESHDRGWPGGHFIYYRLLDGTHVGDIIYVAEHLRDLLPAGTPVRAGQKIAEALPGGTGTEWGWADADGATRAGRCYHAGEQTHSGQEMARFMLTLGAPIQDAPGPGPDGPFGKSC